METEPGKVSTKSKNKLLILTLVLSTHLKLIFNKIQTQVNYNNNFIN